MNSSINREISQIKENVYKYLYRVEVLERLLSDKELPMAERIRLEKELSEVKEGILKSEEELHNFYGKNRKTFMFAVMLMFLTFLFYGIYLMIINPN